MGKDSSIDLSLKNIWRCWWEYKKGKKKTLEFYRFQEYLEVNLDKLHRDLNKGDYRHGGYRTFIVSDNKRREVSLSIIRDRIVHRLLYDYLIPIYDKTFLFDVWSCRKGKGLLRAIERTQEFLRRYPNAWIWKGDVRKFFDHVDHGVLLKCLERRVVDKHAIKLLREVISSYSPGIPIGNLTSQIFANIYLHELDRFIQHELKPTAYLRYGDDVLLLEQDKTRLIAMTEGVRVVANSFLRLPIQNKSDRLIRPRAGLKFLGVVIYSHGRRLSQRNWRRMMRRVNELNINSYWGLIRSHESAKRTMLRLGSAVFL